MILAAGAMLDRDHGWVSSHGRVITIDTPWDVSQQSILTVTTQDRREASIRSVVAYVTIHCANDAVLASSDAADTSASAGRAWMRAVSLRRTVLRVRTRVHWTSGPYGLSSLTRYSSSNRTV